MTNGVIAQALAERAMLDSIAAGFATARYQLELWMGPGNAKWVVIAALVALAFWAFKRR